MKKFNTYKGHSLVILGIILMLLTACAGGDSASRSTEASSGETKIVVVTATPTVEWQVEVAEPVSIEPKEMSQKDVEVEVSVETDADPEMVTYASGTLLKGSGSGVFYVVDDVNRRHIYDWETFLAFGFADDDIVEISDEALALIPMTGELSRLIRTETNQLYWVLDGQRLRIGTSTGDMTIYEQSFDVPVTEVSKTLLTRLPIARFENGDVLQTETDVYYVLNASQIIQISADLIKPQGVVVVPKGVIDLYETVDEIDYVSTTLADLIEGANLREGPDFNANIVDVIENGTTFAVTGRTVQGNWLEVSHQDKVGWMAAIVVENNPLLAMVPVVEYVDIIDLPAAEPAAMITNSDGTQPTTETELLQPIYCTDVPIRGFGKVWGDNLSVQHTLGCPYSWTDGETATDAAIQMFQNGVMVWLETDTSYGGDPVYVFFYDGNFQRFGDLGAADPASVEPIPEGFFEIGDYFSKVYWEGTGARVQERLGHAISEMQPSAGAFQEFNRGRMFWVEASDEIYVIYDYSYYDETMEESVWVKTWERYEDKF